MKGTRATRVATLVEERSSSSLHEITVHEPKIFTTQQMGFHILL